MVRKAISLAILASFLFWVVWYVTGNIDKFAAIGEVAWPDVFVLTVVFLTILICNGMFIVVVASAFQIRLGSVEWLALSFASSFANYFLPFKGGTGLRALYMSKIHGFPVTKFISTLSVIYLMHIVVNGILGLVGMGLIKLHGGHINMTVFIFFVLVSLLGVLAITIDIDIKTRYERFPMAQLRRVFVGWKKVRHDRALVGKLWLLMLVLTLATIWQCKVAFEAVSISISSGGVLIYAASKNLAMLVSLTPGSLGVVEVFSIYLGTVLNYSTSDALLVQGLIRSVAIIVLLILEPVALLLLRRRIKSSEQIT